MWQVLKAEIKYNKLMLSIAYSLAFIFFVAGRIWNMEGIHEFIAITAVIFFISVIMMGSESDKEKRDRLYMRLPITLKQISIVRLLFMFIFQAGMVFLWGIVFFLEHFGFDNQMVWGLLGMNAFIFIIIAFFILYHDLGFFHTAKYRIMYIAILILFFTVIIWFTINGYIKTEYFSIGNTFPNSFAVALIYNMICAGMYYIIYVLFLRRKTYLA